MLKLKNFFSRLSNSVVTILKVLVFSRFFTKPPKRINDTCIILGNGPSLSNSLDESESFLTGKDLICVNFFPLTPLFQELKPRFFICCDPAFWKPELTPESSAQIDKLYATIAKVDWEMTFLIPTSAKKRKDWKSKLSSNKNIKIHFYNVTPIGGFESLVFFFLKRRLGSPSPFNVLIPSILQCINMSYEKIYLFGVDHSWLKDLSISEQNEVFIGNRHFYTKDERIEKSQLGRKDTGKWKLHQVLETFSIVFKGHYTLNQYANSQNVEIFNLTPGSFIDSFPRLKHPEETIGNKTQSK